MILNDAFMEFCILAVKERLFQISMTLVILLFWAFSFFFIQPSLFVALHCMFCTVILFWCMDVSLYISHQQYGWK